MAKYEQLKDISSKRPDGQTYYPYKMIRGANKGRFVASLSGDSKRRQPFTEDELRKQIETGGFRESGRIVMCAEGDESPEGSGYSPTHYKGCLLSQINSAPTKKKGFDFIKALKSGNYGFSQGGGGEGPGHKALKEFIFDNPSSIGIDRVVRREQEFALPSGDKLDIFFETEKTGWAVEVKSTISNKADIMRGVFQCIKYRAVMEAVNLSTGSAFDVNVCLVMEGRIPPELADLCRKFKVIYFDKISPV